ncbi:hypothetical protein ACEQ8H_004318 [Pleosporales sp. CAS-2024a]
MGEGISCTLNPVNLHDNPDFDAISYCWGEPSEKVVIQCNDRQILVTRNLYDALQQVRNPKTARTLWVDGINQNDIAERGHHVNLMKKVFGKAKSVSICVGRCDNGETKGVFRPIKIVLDHFHPYTGSWDRLREAPPPEPGHEMCDPKAWARTIKFFMRPWFSRVWVLQEVGLSSSSVLFCGSETLAWVDILRFRLRLPNRRDITCIRDEFFLNEHMVAGRMIDAFATLWCTSRTDRSREKAKLWCQYYPPERHIKVSAITFLDILITASRFEATDPRDFTYAFLGHPSARLTTEGSHGLILVEPDYTISVGYDTTLSSMTLKIRAIILGYTARSGVAQDSIQMIMATQGPIVNPVEETWDKVAKGIRGTSHAGFRRAFRMFIHARRRFSEWQSLPLILKE